MGVEGRGRAGGEGKLKVEVDMEMEMPKVVYVESGEEKNWAKERRFEGMADVGLDPPYDCHRHRHHCHVQSGVKTGSNHFQSTRSRIFYKVEWQRYICCRPSVCRLSSVCNARAPYSAG